MIDSVWLNLYLLLFVANKAMNQVFFWGYLLNLPLQHVNNMSPLNHNCRTCNYRSFNQCMLYYITNPSIYTIQQQANIELGLHMRSSQGSRPFWLERFLHQMNICRPVDTLAMDILSSGTSGSQDNRSPASVWLDLHKQVAPHIESEDKLSQTLHRLGSQGSHRFALLVWIWCSSQGKHMEVERSLLGIEGSQGTHSSVLE